MFDCLERVSSSSSLAFYTPAFDTDTATDIGRATN
jgi:hypothetical protein